MISVEDTRGDRRTTGRVRIRSTTVVAVLRDGVIALAADGQVTIGETVMKQRAGCWHPGPAR